MLGNTKLKARLSYLILKQIPKRFNDLLKIHMIRQTADIMVRLDHCRFAAETALHHVGIDRSLHQKFNRADLLCFFLKYADKFLADDLALPFRFRHALQFLIETLLRIHTDKIELIITVGTEYGFYLVALVFS